MSLPLLHAGRTNPGLSAALDLRFALDKSLTAYRGPTPSFSRASTGTFFNSSGVLTSAAINAPRFNHTYNGTSWVSRGLLVEEQRTNGLLRSNEFSNAAWDKLNVAVSTDSTISPEGTTAAKVTPSTSSSVQKAIYQTLTIANSANAHSIYIKAGTQNFIQLMFNGADFNYANFDISTGVTGNKTAGVSSSSISDVGNGWYRISMTLTNSGATGWTLFWINSLTDGRAPSVTSTGSIYLFGAQYEVGSFPTSYIPTTSASTTRSADVCQITGSDFSGFWNGTEGTLACEFDRLSPVTAGGQIYPRTFLIGTSGNFIDHFTNTGSPYQEIFQSYSGGAQQFSFGGYINTGITTQKYALAFASNDSAVSCNGTAVQADNTCVVPTVSSQMSIGYNIQNGSNFLNGHIARLRYYNKRLPNATLQLLSEPDPTLNLQFALNKSLTPVAGPAPSFSRASTGSYFDSTGTLKYANVNLLTYSEQFDNAAWTKGSTTIFSNSIISPDSSLSSDSLLETATTAVHYANRSTSAGTGIFTFSVFLKKLGRQYAVVAIDNGSAGRGYVFDLDNGLAIGQVDTGSTGQVAYVSHSISNAGNGWYRCAITANVLSGNPVVAIVTRLTSTTAWAESYAGDTSKGVYAWGAQLELASSPSQYAKTEASTTAGPRFDHVFSGGQWVSRGLLIEEQRTNLVTYSEDLTNAGWTKANATINANAVSGPDGLTAADEIVETTATGNHGSHSPVSTVGSGATFTASGFIKKKNKRYALFYVTDNATQNISVLIDMDNGTIVGNGSGFGADAAPTSSSITNVGNGWYRISITRTNSVGQASARVGAYLTDDSGSLSTGFSYAGSTSNGIYAWGFQIETATFQTSYIPSTGAASTTRSADVCQITGTSFNWMWNQGEGSVVAEYDRLFSASSISNASTVFQAFIDGNNNDRYALFHNSSGTVGERFNVTVGNVEYANLDSGVSVSQPVGRASSAYKLNDFALTVNGGSIVSDTSGLVVSNADKLNIGRMYASNWLNGHIAKLIYYPARLTNTKLQQLST